VEAGETVEIRLEDGELKTKVVEKKKSQKNLTNAFLIFYLNQ